MFGDVLRRKAYLLATASGNKLSDNAFWVILRNIAVEDIKACYPDKVDSVNAVPLYYSILKENIQYIPQEYIEKMPSNNQEKFRVKNRNMWTSNAFHPEGLANQPGIIAERTINENRKGDRIIYQGDGT
jgi:hypothetical protein